jgi:hypothetical protein
MSHLLAPFSIVAMVLETCSCLFIMHVLETLKSFEARSNPGKSLSIPSYLDVISNVFQIAKVRTGLQII